MGISDNPHLRPGNLLGHIAVSYTHLDVYKRQRQHNPLSQQKEFRAIKNAIIQEAERLRQQMEQAQATSEQEASQDEEPSAENTSTDASTNPTLADENTSSTPCLLYTSPHSLRIV